MGVTTQRPLFRSEVIEFQRSRGQWGQVLVLQSVPVQLLSWSLVLSVALIVGFLFVAQYARKETTPGYLTPTMGTARVFPPQPGVVEYVHVAEGQHVAAGEKLLTIRTSQYSIDGSDVNSSVLRALAGQKQVLLDQIADQQRRTASERDRLTQMIAGLQSQLGHLGDQIELQRGRIAIADKMVAFAKNLRPSALIPEVELRRREAAVLEQRQALDSLSQQFAATQNRITEMRATLDQLPATEGQKVLQIKADLATLEQHMVEVEGRRAYVVRSPIDGTVSSLQAMPGQPADPRQLLLQIVPSHSELRAELFVPSRAIGFVHQGQEVRVLYDAFPYQQFGTYKGRVVQISRTVLLASDLTTPVKLDEPAYKVTVALDRQDISAYGHNVELQPDMLLKADIILEHRPLIRWLLGPLLDSRLQE